MASTRWPMVSARCVGWSWPGVDGLSKVLDGLGKVSDGLCKVLDGLG